MPNAISAVPRATRTQEAQVGGALCRSPSRSEAPMKTTVSATSPSSQPPRNARLAGRGRGACMTSTAGMTVIGDSAMISASGMSLVSTEPQFPATGSNPCITPARMHGLRAAGSIPGLQSVNSVVEHHQADQDQDCREQRGVVFLHPVFEPCQRIVEAMTGARVGQYGDGDR